MVSFRIFCFNSHLSNITKMIYTFPVCLGSSWILSEAMTLWIHFQLTYSKAETWHPLNWCATNWSQMKYTTISLCLVQSCHGSLNYILMHLHFDGHIKWLTYVEMFQWCFDAWRNYATIRHLILIISSFSLWI